MNRIDDTIIFNALKPEDMEKIILLEIKKLEDRITEVGFKLKIDKSALQFLAKEGYDEQYGARPLNRAIQRFVEDPVADEILSENVKEGGTINITVNKENTGLVLKSSKDRK